MGAYTALCTYLAQPEKISVLSDLLNRHWPALHRYGLVTDDPAQIYFGEDYSGPFFVEIMTWASPEAPGQAYWIEEINDIWTELYNNTEPRDGRPGIDYPTVRRQALFNTPAATLASGKSAPERMKTAWDWDTAYRSGRHEGSWNLDCGSPELIDYLSTHALQGRQATALDLGCGTGSDCIALAGAGYAVAGVDISAEALRIARRRSAEAAVQVTWLTANALQLPFAANSFDLVTDRGCLHHISEENRWRYAEEVRRLLKPGGTLFLRGCAVPQFPFVPVTQESVSRHFSMERFERTSIGPISLVTNGGSLAGNLFVIKSRKGAAL